MGLDKEGVWLLGKSPQGNSKKRVEISTNKI